VRAALERLGPVFCGFGLYLSARVDLLPAVDCVELSLIPDRAAATPPDVIRELVMREVGAAKAYVAFEEEPLESRLVFQAHRAWLRDEGAVLVKVVHPEWEEQVAHDAELLGGLEGTLAEGEWADLPLGELIADYRRTLEETSFLREADFLQALAEDAEGSDLLAAAAVEQELCTARVLTIGRLPGVRLSDLVGAESEGAAGTKEGSWKGRSFRQELARRLCVVWLRQALLGRAFPVAPRLEDVLVLPEMQFAFTGGEAGRLPPGARRGLLDYLAAAATWDLDRACDCLLAEMEPESRPARRAELRRRLRQACPFRDGDWGDGHPEESLAEHLFVHWKMATRHGCRPRLHLLEFFRGLFVVAAVARRLVPARDMLLEAVGEVRLTSTVSQFQQMLTPRELSESVDKYAALLVDLPNHVDTILTLAAEGHLELRQRDTSPPPGSGPQLLSSRFAAGLLVLTAAVLIACKFGDSGTGQIWADGMAALFVLITGAFVLRAVNGDE
jgi:predicted unusual protein kinase regulating ubiquinone biosynthesis (AarF/ABC1/UbiB family)